MSGSLQTNSTSSSRQSPRSQVDRTAPNGLLSEEHLRVDTSHDRGNQPAPEAQKPNSQNNGQDVLFQAGQLAQQLQERLNDINRREQAFHSQLAMFEQEQRQFSLWKQQKESSIQERDGLLSRQESQVREQLADCQRLAIQIEQKNPELVEVMTSALASNENGVLSDQGSGLQYLVSLAAAWNEEKQRAGKTIQNLNQQIDHLHKAAESDEMQAELASLERARLGHEKQQKMLRKQEHFQKNHLEKLRVELDQSKTHLLKEVQQWKNSLQQKQSALELRTIQLDRVRNLLDDREAGIERKQLLLGEKRKLLDVSTEHEKELLNRQQESVANQQLAQREEIARQKEEIENRQGELSRRQAQFGKMRAELENAHRKTLQMRQAVEQTWGELSGISAIDSEAAQARVEEIQAELRKEQRETAQTANERTEQLQGFQEKLEELESARQERHDLSVRDIEDRLDDLRRREIDFQSLLIGYDREKKYDVLKREQWLAEKFEAEKIIRGLLDQLASSNPI